MKLVKQLSEHVGARPDKFYKDTLFRSDRLLLGINCLEPGQTQAAHAHDDQDKFYYVVSGTGRFLLGEDEMAGEAGQVIWAPAGVVHGVTNEGSDRLTILVGIAPAP